VVVILMAVSVGIFAISVSLSGVNGRRRILRNSGDSMSLTGNSKKMRLSITWRSCLRGLSDHRKHNSSIYCPWNPPALFLHLSQCKPQNLLVNWHVNDHKSKTDKVTTTVLSLTPHDEQIATSRHAKSCSSVFDSLFLDP